MDNSQAKDAAPKPPEKAAHIQTMASKRMGPRSPHAAHSSTPPGKGRLRAISQSFSVNVLDSPACRNSDGQVTSASEIFELRESKGITTLRSIDRSVFLAR